MTKKIDEKVLEKTEEMRRAFQSRPNLEEERKEYLEQVKNFTENRLPVNNYELSKKINYPIIC